MRISRIIALSLAAVLALSACKGQNNSTSSQKPVDVQWGENSVAAVAFLGYYDNYTEFSTSTAYPVLVKTFPQLQGLSSIAVSTFGDELYLVIPRDNVSSVAVNEYTFDMFMGGDSNGQIYYKGESEPFLMKCNHDDSLPDTQMVILAADGSVVEYSPALDINSGSLKTDAAGAIVDLTSVTPANIGEVCWWNDESFGIGAFVKNGRPVLMIDQKKLIDAGIVGEEGLSVDLESPAQKVGGINGLCSKVFFSNYGMDYNPVLIAVMDDGSVKLMSVFRSLYTGDITLGGAVPSAAGAVSFREEGEGYTKIFASKADGTSSEVAMYQDTGSLQQEAKDGKVHVLQLTEDWHMTYTILEDMSVVKSYTGVFYLINAEELTSTYGYKFTSCATPASNGDVAESEELVEGEFSISMDEDGLETSVTPLKGLDFGCQMKKATVFTYSNWGE